MLAQLGGVAVKYVSCSRYYLFELPPLLPRLLREQVHDAFSAVFFPSRPTGAIFRDTNDVPTTVVALRQIRACRRWFEEAGDGAGGWDIEKITNRIGESECHVVNEDNVMELNLVDLVGKTTGQGGTSTDGDGGDGSDSSPASATSTPA